MYKSKLFDTDKNPTTLYLVRHGESVWNTKGLLQGQKHTPENVLTKKGEAQAAKLRKTLKGIRFDAAYSSDLLRAHKTAEIVSAEHNLIVQTTQALREKSHGEHEGTSSAEYTKLFTQWAEMTDKERLRYKITDNGESPEEAMTRFILFLKEISIAQTGRTILIVTHGGVMRDFLVKLGTYSYDTLKGFANTGYIKLRCDGVEFFVDEIVGAKSSSA